MIFDQIVNLDVYFKPNKSWGKTFSFIRSNPVPKDIYEIDGRDIYASVSYVETRDSREVSYEAHRKDVDIHSALKVKKYLFFLH